jgi:hypothetical protein
LIKWKPLDPANGERIVAAVVKTASGGMTQLVEPGWLSKPKGPDATSGTPFHFIMQDGDPIGDVEPEKNLPNRPEGRGMDAGREWGEWKLVVKWDKKLAKTWDETLRGKWTTLAADQTKKPDDKKSQFRKLWSEFLKELEN